MHSELITEQTVPRSVGYRAKDSSLLVMQLNALGVHGPRCLGSTIRGKLNSGTATVEEDHEKRSEEKNAKKGQFFLLSAQKFSKRKLGRGGARYGST